MAAWPQQERPADLVEMLEPRKTFPPFHNPATREEMSITFMVGFLVSTLSNCHITLYKLPQYLI